MENISDRIVKVIDYLGISRNAFARQIGISSSLISQITTKKNNFRADILQKITTEYPQVNATWLLSGIGEMWIDHPTIKKEKFSIDSDYKPNIDKEEKKKQIRAHNIMLAETPVEEFEGHTVSSPKKEWVTEKNFVKLTNHIRELEGDYKGLLNNIEDLESFRDFSEELSRMYFDRLFKPLLNYNQYLTGNKFDYSGYRESVLNELETIKEINKPLSTLVKAIHIFYKEFKEVDKFNILRDSTIHS